jgi:hypothetical protein
MKNKKTTKMWERDRSPKKNKYAIDMRAEKQSDLSCYTKQTLTGLNDKNKWSTINNVEQSTKKKIRNRNRNLSSLDVCPNDLDQ